MTSKIVQGANVLLRVDSGTTLDASAGSLILDVPFLDTPVDSINNGTHALIGDVTLAAGTAMTASVSGNTITFNNAGVVSNTVGTAVLTGAVTLVATGSTTLSVSGNSITIHS